MLKSKNEMIRFKITNKGIKHTIIVRCTHIP